MLLWALIIMFNKIICVTVMDLSRESKLNDAFATPLLNNINNKVTELKVSELRFKHMFNEKEPIVGYNKVIFTHLKTVNCDNYCNSTYMVFSSILYECNGALNKK